ncbi:hypothetical protein [Algoriphagus sp.]|uniref:hypothetical protein n=1 Tax=Algoriphagus sp. TaxID=1872435 RepID=UPI0025CE8C14|nr:hypothetical protein [Algoriphagus sp.]
MIKVDRTNKSLALQVLISSFRDNPGVLWVIKKDNKIEERIAVLCNYCLTVAMEKEGAFITSDGKGVALIFKSWKKQQLTNWLLGYAKLWSKCIGWNRPLTIINREAEITKRRPKKKHLYFWMLAVRDRSEGLNPIKEIRDFVYEYSRKEQLPIFAETAAKNMLPLYKRYGFSVYDQWEHEGLNVWFIERPFDPICT